MSLTHYMTCQTMNNLQKKISSKMSKRSRNRFERNVIIRSIYIYIY